MDDILQLYQQTVIDHYRNPRSKGDLENAHRGMGINAMCGDEVTVYARVEDGIIAQASFTGRGCAVSQASASMLTEALVGMSVSQVRALCLQVTVFVEAGTGTMPKPMEEMAAITRFPERKKCCMLVIHALERLLNALPK